MSYYKDFNTNPKTCKNFRDGRDRQQTRLEATEASDNSKTKNLHMVPCAVSGRCCGYVFAGADSGSTPFCYNYEPKPP